MEKKYINIKLLMYLAIGYSFITPYYFTQIDQLFLINKGLLGLSFIFIFLVYVSGISDNLINQGVIFIVIYYLLVLISTQYNQVFHFNTFASILLGIAFSMLISFIIQNKKEFINFLLAMNILMYTYISINLILIYVYPDGIPSILQERGTRYYLFGNVNTTTRYVLPGLLFTFLYDVLQHRKIRKRSWLLLIMSWLTLIKVWTVTGMIGLFVFTVITFVTLNRKKAYIIYIGSLISSLTITTFLIFFKFESNILIGILNIFEKDVTFSSRDVLWMNAIDIIKQSFYWGIGDVSNEDMKYLIGNSYGSHNYYLDILLRGGFITFSFFLIGLIYVSRQIARSKGSIVTRLFVSISVAYFIMWIAEPFFGTEYLMFSIMFVLMSQIHRLEAYYFDDTEIENDLGVSYEK